MCPWPRHIEDVGPIIGKLVGITPLHSRVMPLSVGAAWDLMPTGWTHFTIWNRQVLARLRVLFYSHASPRHTIACEPCSQGDVICGTRDGIMSGRLAASDTHFRRHHVGRVAQPVRDRA